MDSVSLASTWRLCHLQSFPLQFGHILQSRCLLWSLGLNESSKGELEGLVETVSIKEQWCNARNFREPELWNPWAMCLSDRWYGQNLKLFTKGVRWNLKMSTISMSCWMFLYVVFPIHTLTLTLGSTGNSSGAAIGTSIPKLRGRKVQQHACVKATLHTTFMYIVRIWGQKGMIQYLWCTHCAGVVNNFLVTFHIFF